MRPVTDSEGPLTGTEGPQMVSELQKAGSEGLQRGSEAHRLGSEPAQACHKKILDLEKSVYLFLNCFLFVKVQIMIILIFKLCIKNI